MNQSAEESLMALLEAMLTLAAGTEARRQPPKPPVNPGGYPEEIFLDLTEEDQEELSCSICYQILKETMQCINHHKFCHSCLVVWSTTGEYANRVKCPVCRTRGYYFRNDDIDTKVGNKKVKCRMDSCSWTGQLKYLNSHRHNTYGEESVPASETDSKTDCNVSSIPRLEQVVPRAPPATAARFVGTGLTTRNANLESTPQITASPRIPIRTASRASSSSLSSNSQETVIDLRRDRGRMGSTSNSSNGATSLLASRRPVPPVRAPGSSRITFSHSRANNSDSNNSGEGVAPSTSESVEGLSNSTAGGFTPRPPSAPRTSSNSVNPRRLPRIINPIQPRNRAMPQPQSQPQLSEASGMNFESQTQNETGTNLGNIRNHLQDSRNRLNNLMSSFTNELDRNRQEMMQFQQERENQRREQLEEVRQLSQRLGQVAFELRRLLEHRRGMPSFSDSDNDDD